MGAMGNRSLPQILQRHELYAAKKWKTMSKISRRVSAFTSKQMQFLFFLHYTSTFYTSRTIGVRENVFHGLFIYFLGKKKKIQNNRCDQRPDEYGT